METLSRPNIILADKFGQQLCEALGIDSFKSHTSRIVLDVRASEPIRVYVEMLGSDKLLDIQLPTTAVEVVTKDATQ